MAQPQLGRTLRTIRKELGLSLTEVAQAAEISPSFLSMVETGNSDISIGRLLRLTRQYGVQIGDVVDGSETRTPEVIRAGAHGRLDSVEEGLMFEFLAGAHHPLRPILVHFEPGGETIEPLAAAGDAFLYLLEGEIAVTLDGHEAVALRRGDSAYLPGELSRSYANRADGRAVLISVVLRADERTNGAAVTAAAGLEARGAVR